MITVYGERTVGPSVGCVGFFADLQSHSLTHSLTMKRKKLTSRLNKILQSCESLEEHQSQNVTTITTRQDNIEPRLLRFEVTEIENARKSIVKFEDQTRRKRLTESRRMKRRYDNEINDMMRDMSHRERRLEARAAHYEQRYIEAINESFALEQIVARELEFRRMGEKTILDLENSMQKNHSIEEGHIKEVEDEIRNKYERNERERERRFKQELELQKSVHNQALENAKREYEKKLSKFKSIVLLNATIFAKMCST